jgi:CBS domain-containing protein
MKIHEVMRTHVIKTTLDATMRDMVDLMDLYQVTMVPVVDDEQRVLGVVTEEDVSAALLPKLIAGEDPAEGSSDNRLGGLPQVRVAEVMRTSVPELDETEDIRSAAIIMSASGVSPLPVTCAGRLVGTISRIDICQGCLEERAPTVPQT